MQYVFYGDAIDVVAVLAIIAMFIAFGILIRVGK